MMRLGLAGVAVLAVTGCAGSHQLARCGHGPKEAYVLPSVWDDGQSTYFNFGPRGSETRIPVFYAVNPDGKEAIASYTVQGSQVIVHQTAPEFRLRDGESVLCIKNNAWTPSGSSPGTGTTSPSVVRVTRGA